MKYKSVIFDFNGVLLFDSHFHELAWNKMALKLRGNEFISKEIEEHVHGRPNQHTLSYLSGTEIYGEELVKLINEKETIYKTMCLENPHEFILSPGSKDLLNFLKLNNIPITIATASEINNLEFFFENLKLDTWFDFNKCVWDSGKIRGKPHPDKYIIAAYNNNVHPKDSVVIEDSISGMKAAHSAGIGFIYGLGEKDKHEKIKSVEGVSDTIVTLEDFNRDLVEVIS